ncbi:MAG TPA: hypothetical protein PKD51_06335 [Saprospiraceae bacterium]|mgnify:CR=1 FL=1|nr:hypothetical protein [Saprospiraceae bacterium]
MPKNYYYIIDSFDLIEYLDPFGIISDNSLNSSNRILNISKYYWVYEELFTNNANQIIITPEYKIELENYFNYGKGRINDIENNIKEISIDNKKLNSLSLDVLYSLYFSLSDENIANKFENIFKIEPTEVPPTLLNEISEERLEVCLQIFHKFVKENSNELKSLDEISKRKYFRSTIYDIIVLDKIFLANQINQVDSNRAEYILLSSTPNKTYRLLQLYFEVNVTSEENKKLIPYINRGALRLRFLLNWKKEFRNKQQFFDLPLININDETDIRNSLISRLESLTVNNETYNQQQNKIITYLNLFISKTKKFAEGLKSTDIKLKKYYKYERVFSDHEILVQPSKDSVKSLVQSFPILFDYLRLSMIREYNEFISEFINPLGYQTDDDLIYKDKFIDLYEIFKLYDKDVEIELLFIYFDLILGYKSNYEEDNSDSEDSNSTTQYDEKLLNRVDEINLHNKPLSFLIEYFYLKSFLLRRSGKINDSLKVLEDLIGNIGNDSNVEVKILHSLALSRCSHFYELLLQNHKEKNYFNYEKIEHYILDTLDCLERCKNKYVNINLYEKIKNQIIIALDNTISDSYSKLYWLDTEKYKVLFTRNDGKVSKVKHEFNENVKLKLETSYIFHEAYNDTEFCIELCELDVLFSEKKISEADELVFHMENRKAFITNEKLMKDFNFLNIVTFPKFEEQKNQIYKYKKNQIKKNYK